MNVTINPTFQSTASCSDPDPAEPGEDTGDRTDDPDDDHVTFLPMKRTRAGTPHPVAKIRS
jgi:hypothetical protein